MADLDWQPEFGLLDGLADSYSKDFGRGTFRKEADFTAGGERCLLSGACVFACLLASQPGQRRLRGMGCRCPWPARLTVCRLAAPERAPDVDAAPAPASPGLPCRRHDPAKAAGQGACHGMSTRPGSLPCWPASLANQREDSFERRWGTAPPPHHAPSAPIPA